MVAEARRSPYGLLRLVAAAAVGAMFALAFLASPFHCPDVPVPVSSHESSSQPSISPLSVEPPPTNAESSVRETGTIKPDATPGCGRLCETCNQFCVLVAKHASCF